MATITTFGGHFISAIRECWRDVNKPTRLIQPLHYLPNPLAGESQFFSEGGLGKGETQAVIH
jgi:hypothetical protein